MMLVSKCHMGANVPGFENANEPCCGGHFPPFVCFKAANESSQSILCDDRSKYVLF